MRKNPSSASRAKKTASTPPAAPLIATSATGDLFDRVASILEQARKNVARSVNSNMVLAYWLIGREIVQEIQKGSPRADYGENLIENLSRRLVGQFGRGFSVANIRNFRQFYFCFPDRVGIRYPAGSELGSHAGQPPKRYLAGSVSADRDPNQPDPANTPGILHPAGRELEPGFSPDLSWSHYRALMRVSKKGWCESRWEDGMLYTADPRRDPMNEERLSSMCLRHSRSCTPRKSWKG